ncbi:hypothetical protein MRX96_020052 [Rhipicephalus microplus]
MLQAEFFDAENVEEGSPPQGRCRFGSCHIDVLEPRRSVRNMDACDETAVPTSLPVEPLDFPLQAFWNGSDVENCPATRNPFELIFQGPSVPERVTTPPNLPPHHPLSYNVPPFNPPLSNSSQAASCPRDSEEVSLTPQQRSKRQRQRELETVDDELNAVRNLIAAHKPMDANRLFLLSLKPYLQSTPQEMLTDLKMNLLHVGSTYSGAPSSFTAFIRLLSAD